MKPKKPSSQATAIIISMGIIFSLVLTLCFSSIKSIEGSQLLSNKDIAAVSKVAPLKIRPVVPGLPIRLKIPKIKVDSAFEYAGLTPQGAVDVPDNFANVAWFNLGPRPGEEGSSIITGHYGRKNGKASVFDNLYKLRKGDKIYVEDEQGVAISFIVRETRRYDQAAVAANVFSSGDGKAHLNLITCEGFWSKTLKGYPTRLVVFTERE